MGTNAYGYVFDPIGNRIVSTNNADVTSYAANELNQYTAISNAVPVLPVHDDDGNMTFLPSTTGGGAGGEGWYLQWDGENRLRSVSSNNVLLATHTYDHQSRRVGKISHEDAKTRNYVYDGWNLIQGLTHSQTHTLTNLYTWGLDLSGSLQGAGGVGGLLAVVQDGGTHCPAFDVNGNVTEYITSDGTIAAHYEYDAFGCTMAQSGSLSDSFVFRFSTKYWEEDGGFYYYGYRCSTPGLGMWLSRDPVGERGGANLYGIVKNDLVGQLDPYGLRPENRKMYASINLNEETCCEGCEKVKRAWEKQYYMREEVVGVWWNLYRDLFSTKFADDSIVISCDSSIPAKDGKAYMYPWDFRPPRKCRIRIGCGDKPVKTQEYANALVHELTHCYQYFEQGKPQSCKEVLCAEVQAYWRGTDPGHQKFLRQNFAPLMDEAWQSAKNNRLCKDENSRQDVVSGSGGSQTVIDFVNDCIGYAEEGSKE